jgi:hypothetical protein
VEMTGVVFCWSSSYCFRFVSVADDESSLSETVMFIYHGTALLLLPTSHSQVEHLRVRKNDKI